VSVTVLAALPLAVMRPHHYANDAVAATECATHLFLQGHNPYTSFNLVDCFARHGLNGVYTTPLQAGRFAPIHLYPTQPDLLRTFAQIRHDHLQHPAMFESFFNYPAGAFLLTAPFAALGWHDLSTFYLFWALLAYAVLLWRAPRSWRPWLLIMAAAHTTLWTNIADGQSNVLDACLILAAWATWRRLWLSAALLGLAVATRQEAWLFTPFYLVLCGRLVGWRAVAGRLAVITGVFGLVNAPFIALSGRAWLHGVMGPLTDPMFPLGQGAIALATSGVLPLWPREVYAGLELAACMVCLLLYLRICRRHPSTGPVLALVPVIFAWRSLFTYFYVALPLVCLWVFIVAISAQDSAPGVSRGTGQRLPGGRDDPVQPGAGQLDLDRDGPNADDRDAWPLIA
jgi:hypothetical protein